jgi:predicted dehydrogenase
MREPAKSQRSFSRRRFLERAGAALAAFQLAPAGAIGWASGAAPSNKLGIACIGAGGRGRASVDVASGENLVALCDVDEREAGATYEKYPQPKKFRDFRKMLDELEKSIDAVTVATPDHTHAAASLEAMRRGKHVYCEKPLAHSAGEIRALMKAAREHKVVTQLGNQGHSFDSIRSFCEWIWDGAIGSVSEVHAFCDAFRDVYCQIDKLPRLAEKHEVPATLDYDLWLGPAPFRPYSPLWVPWNWRGWMPFGSGCIGDWVCHVLDPSVWALDLGAPATVRAEVQGYDPEKHADVYPRGVKVTFQFPPKGKRGPVKLIWFDGSERPPRPAELEPDQQLPGIGAVVYGDKGTIVHGSHGAGGVRLIPAAKMKEYRQPEKTLPRVRDHHEDWLEAIRGGREAGASFAYGGPLTEIGLLGAIAIRFPGEELAWDTERLRFSNSSAASTFVAPPWRQGWSV